MNDYNDAIEQFGPPPSPQQALKAAEPADPVKAGKAFTLGQEFGVPAGAVEPTLPEWEGLKRQKEFDKALSDIPELGQYLTSTSEAAAVSKNDVTTLGGVMKKAGELLMMNPLVRFQTYTATKTLEGAAEGYSSQEYGRLAARYQAGDTSVLPRLEEYEAKPQLKKTGVDRFLNAFGSFLGSTASSLKVAAPAAGAGAVIGSAGGGVGAIPGAIFGGVTGLSADMGIATSGQVYRQLDLARGANGEKIDESVKQAASVGAGLAVAALGQYGTGKVVGGFVSEVTTKLVAQPIIQQSIKKSVGEVAEAGLTMGALNVGMTLAQQISIQSAKFVSAGEFETVMNSPAERTRFVESVVDAAVDGLALGMMLKIPQVGHNRFVDQMRANEADRGKQMLSELLASREASETFKNAPALFSEALGHVTKENEIGLSADFVDANIERFGYLRDIRQRLEFAANTGSDVKIPLKDFIAHTDKDVAFAALDHLRIGEGMTPAEAKALGESYPASKNIQQEPSVKETSPEVAKAEAAVKAERKSLWLEPLFTSPDAVGISKSDFAKYSKHIQNVQAKIGKSTFDAVHAEIKRTETKLWKDSVNKQTEIAREELSSRSDFFAERNLREDSTLRLDRNAVDTLYNTTEGTAYWKYHAEGEKASSAFSEKIFAEGGLHPDDVAPLMGYDTGRAMLDDLLKLESARKKEGLTEKAFFEKTVNEEGLKKVDALEGSLDDRVLRKTMEHVVDIAQLDVLADEVKMLGAGIGKIVSKDDLVSAVKGSFAQSEAGKVRSLDSYKVQIAKHGLEAERALLSNDPVEAFKAKQRQFLSFSLAKEVKEFIALREKTSRIVERFQDSRVLEAVDQGYTDQIHKFFETLGLKHPRNGEELARSVTTPLDEFIKEKEAVGVSIPEPYKDFINMHDKFSVAEFRSFANFMQSMNYHGRQEKIVEINNKRELFEQVVDRGLKSLEKIDGTIDNRDMTVKGKIKSLTRSADSALIKMEQLFEWLDKGDTFGTFSGVFRKLKEGQNKQLDLETGLAAKFKEFPRDKEWTKALKDTVKNEDLMDVDGKPMKLSRENMLAIAANMGTVSNMKALTRGHGWAEGDVLTFLNRHMEKRDWDYVKLLWDTAESLWPHVEEAMKKQWGVAVDRVEGRTFNTSHGEIEGKYYPLIEDRISALNKGKVEVEPFYKADYNLNPNASGVHERTGAIYPVSLDIQNGYVGRMKEMVHFAAFADPVREARKVLGDKLLREAITEKMGKEYTEQLNPWLDYIANNGSPDRNWANSMDFFQKASRELRLNAQVMMIGLKPSTAAIHGGAALANSIQEVGQAVGSYKKGSQYFAEAMKEFMSSADVRKAMFEESGELRNRKHTLDRDINNQYKLTLGETDYRRAFASFSMGMVAALDYASAVPTYMAVKRHMLEEGHSQADAVFAAEKAVRNAHGASGLIDQASILRGNEAMRWFTMFYGYWNHNYNRNRDTARMASEVVKDGLTLDPKLFTIAARSFYYIAVPAMVHDYFRHHGDEDESWGHMLARQVTGQIAGGIPFVRDISFSAQSGKSVNATPLSSVGQSVAATIGDVNKAAKGEDPSNWGRHALDAFGWMTGLTTKQANAGAQYLWDLKAGKKHKEEKGWMFNLLLNGQTPERKKK